MAAFLVYGVGGAALLTLGAVDFHYIADDTRKLAIAGVLAAGAYFIASQA